MENSYFSISGILGTLEKIKTDLIITCSSFLEAYGWFLLAGLIILAMYWKNIQKYFDEVYDKREAAKYAAKYHKNPDLALKRAEELEASRRRMQEELTKQSLAYQEKMKQRQEQKLQEKLAKSEDKNGYRLGSTASSSKSHKSDYNPLMGDAGGRYKPSKKSGCPGGGCGRN